jgi:hypothetical protein
MARLLGSRHDASLCSWDSAIGRARSIDSTSAVRGVEECMRVRHATIAGPHPVWAAVPDLYLHIRRARGRASEMVGSAGESGETSAYLLVPHELGDSRNRLTLGARGHKMECKVRPHRGCALPRQVVGCQHRARIAFACSLDKAVLDEIVHRVQILGRFGHVCELYSLLPI